MRVEFKFVSIDGIEPTAAGRFAPEACADEHPGLFESNTDSSVKTKRDPSNGLAYQRVNHSMDAPRAPASDQRLNVHLYWMPPTEYGRNDVDGVFRAFGYKIKYADQEVDTRVANQTRTDDWSVETSGNPYDSNIVFYKHVSSAGDIEATADTLVDHFSEFGDEYAAD